MERKILQRRLLLGALLMTILAAVTIFLALRHGSPEREIKEITHLTVNSTRPMDIAILLDASGSMSHESWTLELDFAKAAVLFMADMFEEHDAVFRASLAQFSTSVIMEINMTEDVRGAFKDLRTWEAFPTSALCNYDRECIAEREECTADPNCIIRHSGCTEMGAGLCGARAEQGVDHEEFRTAETCQAGALGAFGPWIWEDSLYWDSINNDTNCSEAVLPPVGAILLVTDGRPSTPGPDPRDLRVLDYHAGLFDAGSAARVVKNTPSAQAGDLLFFGIMVGRQDLGSEETLYTLTTCCEPEHMNVHNQSSTSATEYGTCDDGVSNLTGCDFYLFKDDFDELFHSVADIVDRLANVQTDVCQNVYEETRRVPGTLYLWFLLLLVPILAELGFGYALFIIACCVGCRDKTKENVAKLPKLPRHRRHHAKDSTVNSSGFHDNFPEAAVDGEGLGGSGFPSMASRLDRSEVALFVAGDALDAEMAPWMWPSQLPLFSGQVVLVDGKGEGRSKSDGGNWVAVVDKDDVAHVSARIKADGATGLIIRGSSPKAFDGPSPGLPTVFVDLDTADILLQEGFLDGAQLKPQRGRTDESGEWTRTRSGSGLKLVRQGSAAGVLAAAGGGLSIRPSVQRQGADGGSGWVYVVRAGTDLASEALRAKADGATGLLVRCGDDPTILASALASETPLVLPVLLAPEDNLVGLNGSEEVVGVEIRAGGAVMRVRVPGSEGEKEVPVLLPQGTEVVEVSKIKGKLMEREEPALDGGFVVEAREGEDIQAIAQRAQASGASGLVIRCKDSAAVLRTLGETMPESHLPTILVDEDGLSIFDRQDGIAIGKRRELRIREVAPGADGRTDVVLQIGDDADEQRLPALLAPGVSQESAAKIHGILVAQQIANARLTGPRWQSPWPRFPPRGPGQGPELGRRLRFKKVEQMSEEEARMTLEQFFRRCNKDIGGKVNRTELLVGLWGAGGGAARRMMGFPDDAAGEELGMFLANADMDGDGALTVDEMLGYWKRMLAGEAMTAEYAPQDAYNQKAFGVNAESEATRAKDNLRRHQVVKPEKIHGMIEVNVNASSDATRAKDNLRRHEVVKPEKIHGMIKETINLDKSSDLSRARRSLKHSETPEGLDLDASTDISKVRKGLRPNESPATASFKPASDEARTILERTFQRCDKNHSCSVNPIQFMAGLWGKEGAPARRLLGLRDNFTGEDLDALFASADSDGDKRLTLEELISYFEGGCYPPLDATFRSELTPRQAFDIDADASLRAGHHKSQGRTGDDLTFLTEGDEEEDESFVSSASRPTLRRQKSRFFVSDSDLPSWLRRFNLRQWRWVVVIVTIALIPAVLLLSGVLVL